MSHAIDNPQLLSPVCPIVGPFRPGAFYRVNGLTQGPLLFDVIGQALGATEMATDVRVILSTGQILSGTFDWTACTITRAEDGRGNSVAGSVNIGLFRWTDPLYVNNTVEEGATFVPADVGAALSVSGNRVGSGSSVDLSGSASALTFEDNVVNSGSSVLLNSGGAVVDFVGNTISNNSSVNVPATNAADVSVLRNQFHKTTFQATGFATSYRYEDNNASSSSLSLTGRVSYYVHNNLLQKSSINSPGANAAGAGTFEVSENLLSGADIQFQNGDYDDGSILVVESTVLDESNIRFVPPFTHAGTLQVRNAFVANNSTIVFNGSGATASQVSRVHVIDSGGITHTSAAGASNISDVSVEHGTLTTAGFDLSNSRLEGVNSTLVADLADATKSGYTNPLP